MEDNLIDFQTAVLAKSKGFDEYCNTIYDQQENINTLQYYEGEGNGFSKNSTPEDEFYCNSIIQICTAPTQSLLQKWLRETHNIYCEAQFRFELLGLIKFESVVMMDYKVIHDASYAIENMFNTYEEALEDALLNALSKIE